MSDDWAKEQRLKAEAEERQEAQKTEQAKVGIERLYAESDRDCRTAPWAAMGSVLGPALGHSVVWATAIVMVTWIIVVMGWRAA